MIADNSYGNELSLMSVKSNVQRGLTGKSIDNYTLYTQYRGKGVSWCESLCPSVCAILSGSYLFYRGTLECVTSCKLVFDQRVCHDFVPRSFGQVLSH